MRTRRARRRRSVAAQGFHLLREDETPGRPLPVLRALCLDDLRLRAREKVRVLQARTKRAQLLLEVGELTTLTLALPADVDQPLEWDDHRPVTWQHHMRRRA